ncbi:MAG: hypothetical protein ACLFP2_01580 [Candidatus Woesearchaeota archaeon]
MTQIVKLAPGSNPLKLGQALITIHTYDRTATLQYAGTNATYENSKDGYRIWNIEILERK